MALSDEIFIKRAREHNLKGFDLRIPKNRLVIFSGLSGSGKSTLAVDTIYAEGQRRYMESLSTYARQFLGQMKKPKVDLIEGLSPAIAIERKSAGANPRSTVGTLTEIYDLLRLLYARCGDPTCPSCKAPIGRESASQMVERLQKLPPDTRLKILAPVKPKGKSPLDFVKGLKRQGYVRFKVNGIETLEPEESIEALKKKSLKLEVVVDRVKTGEGAGSRIADSVETALGLSGGLIVVEHEDGRRESMSEQFACAECGRTMPELTPALFSFNSPVGACERCTGLGTKLEIDPQVLIADPEKPIREGLVQFSGQGEFFFELMERVALQHGFSINSTWNELTNEERNILLYGTENGEKVTYDLSYIDEGLVFSREYEGLVPMLRRRMEKSQSDAVRAEILSLMSQTRCEDCRGARLKPEALAVRVGGRSIAAVAGLTVEAALEFLGTLAIAGPMGDVAEEILAEVRSRLAFLLDVGLPYLSLDRAAASLSGGELQRIHLACQIGSRLTGVLYVLDEPTVGLHPHDTDRLVRTLSRLRDIGNSLIVVEHDADLILAADHVVDLGPGAGSLGGEVLYTGDVPGLLASDALTGKYLSGREQVRVPAHRRAGNGKAIRILGARQHNLASIDVTIPLGAFVCVSGISGSGKSTLVNDILYGALKSHFNRLSAPVRPYDRIEGFEHVDRVINIDQSPIGRTSRSNPATYTGLSTHIREMFSLTREARVRGYKPGRFSFNVKGGRCELCEGEGVRKIEMHFLPDMYVTCEACGGSRFSAETLEILYKGRNVAEVLEATVEEMLRFFQDIPTLRRKLECLNEVGLGYVSLGQSSTTLSGGEAQRVKLAFELSRIETGNTLYILDEPTTGLHFHDVAKLVAVLDRLVEAGNTVLVIEHNLDVLKVADWIIDLGPGGGVDGGRLLYEGPPERLGKVKGSKTAPYLAKVLKGRS